MHYSGVDIWKGLCGITVLRTLNFTFFLIGITPCKTEQPLQGMEL